MCAVLLTCTAPPFVCSECELALDVYQQLLQEGCTPNMVTYNILIDIHSKSGQCDQAVKVLDEIRNQVQGKEVSKMPGCAELCHRVCTFEGFTLGGLAVCVSLLIAFADIC